MRKSLLLASLAISFLAVTAQAQYLTSTKAGFVNNTDGKVYVLRGDSADNEKGRASMGTQLRDGDQLSTSANSRAEVLLNPGSYLRLNENSEIRAVNTLLSEVRMELLKGSAMVEVGQIDKKEPIEIVTPNGTLTISKDTLLRIDVVGAETRVAVRQGEVYVGSRGGSLAANRIGRGKVFSLRGGATADMAKLNKDTADSFDVWSFNRAQTLTAANVQALRRTPTFSAFNGGWYFDPFYNCYTFIPFRGRYFSPYGFGFFNNYGDCYWYNPFFYGNGWNNGGWGGGGGGGTIGANLPPRVVTGADRAPIRREPVGRALDSGGNIFDSGRAGGFGDGGGRAISMPASSAPTVTVSAPAPSRGGDSGGGAAMPSRP